jgi:hypothetical protein
MTLIATEAKRLSNVVKQELWGEQGYTRKVLTLTGDFVPGTVVAVGETILGIAMEEKSGDGVQVLTLVRGPAIVSRGGLVLGQLDIGDVVTALEAVGIQVADTI